MVPRGVSLNPSIRIKIELERRKPGATIVPVILSSDKTQVTLFRSKQAYPVYLTIGNIPKHIRRKPSSQSHILLAYLPTTKLEHIHNMESRRRALINLYHTCLHRILSPLKDAGINGINMRTGRGAIHRVHPLFAVHASDYPEQVLVTCVKSGNCPKCKTEKDNLGDPTLDLEFRNMGAILKALESASKNFEIFNETCNAEKIKPILQPFWKDLPYVNIYRSITPDLLHQLYQGVIKHVFSWIISIYGATEINARCRQFPPNHHIRIFPHGISSLSRVTGQEHNEMCRFLLGLLIRAPVSVPQATSFSVVRAIRAILDFTYIASYPRQSSETLSSLANALDRFHAEMNVFIETGVREQMNLPKLHALRHYIRTIQLFGTTDNYNTEYTERLHIDLAKDAYKATNHKNEFKQMTIWLERKEKVLQQEKYIARCLSALSSPRRRINTNQCSLPPLIQPRIMKMVKHPNVRSVSFDTLESAYCARFFRPALARYVMLLSEPNVQTTRQLEDIAGYIAFPKEMVDVYHKIKFCDASVRDGATVDAIHARPQPRDNLAAASRFDVALIFVGPNLNANTDDIKSTVLSSSHNTSWARSC